MRWHGCQIVRLGGKVAAESDWRFRRAIDRLADGSGVMDAIRRLCAVVVM